MSEFSARDPYRSVAEAEEDIGERLDALPSSSDWIHDTITKSVIPFWTEALTGFEANSNVTVTEEAALTQIETSYRGMAAELERRANVIGSVAMDTLDPGHVLFMVLVRRKQYEYEDRANLNPHKLRVLLDGRYTVG